jgi:putative ABC transport system permease protein
MRPEESRISAVAARWMILGEWRAYPARVIVAALSIAVGVALGFAVHLINASALEEFARAVRTVNGDSDLQVRATTPLGFDETLYPKLARIPGIAGASPAVELSARVNGGRNAPLTLIGVDPLRAAVVTPNLTGQRFQIATATDDPFDASALYLSQAALDATGKHVGDMIELTAAGRSKTFTIVGTLSVVSEDQNIGVIDIAAAHRFETRSRRGCRTRAGGARGRTAR